MEQREQERPEVVDRLVALFVVIAGLLLVPAVLVTVYDFFVEPVPHAGFELAGVGLGAVPLVAAFAAAVKVFRVPPSGPTRRLARWAGGLFVGGLALMVLMVFVRDTIYPPG